MGLVFLLPIALVVLFCHLIPYFIDRPHAPVSRHESLNFSLSFSLPYDEVRKGLSLVSWPLYSLLQYDLSTQRNFIKILKLFICWVHDNGICQLTGLTHTYPPSSLNASTQFQANWTNRDNILNKKVVGEL